MGGIAADPLTEFEKLSSRVLVGGYGRTEGEKSQVLQGVVQLVKRWISFTPEAVAQREKIGCKG
jgi:hypothetical protein